MRWSEEDYDDFLIRQGQAKTVGNAKKKSKYSNKKTIVDGITFDSIREAQEYCNYKLLKKAGAIKDFKLQPKFELQPTFKKNGKTHSSITYTADFKIINNDDSVEIVDVKGFSTNIFKMKLKMFEYKYPDLSLKIVK